MLLQKFGNVIIFILRWKLRYFDERNETNKVLKNYGKFVSSYVNIQLVRSFENYIGVMSFFEGLRAWKRKKSCLLVE